MLTGSGCWWGEECDLEGLTAELAGPDATACGVNRACIADSVAAGVPFTALADRNVTDGREAISYASDGARIVRVDYSFAIGQIFGPDSECVEARTCATLVTDDADCGRPDLCFRCEDPASLSVDCPAP